MKLKFRKISQFWSFEKNYVKEYATIKVLSHMKTYLKYGSWSMAQGMRQGTFLLSPKMKGKDEEKEGAA